MTHAQCTAAQGGPGGYLQGEARQVGAGVDLPLSLPPCLPASHTPILTPHTPPPFLHLAHTSWHTLHAHRYEDWRRRRLTAPRFGARLRRFLVSTVLPVTAAVVAVQQGVSVQQVCCYVTLEDELPEHDCRPFELNAHLWLT